MRSRLLVAQYAIDNNQTVEEIEEQLDLLCDAIPSMGPSQSVFDCDKLAGLPNITFDFSDAEFTLSPEQYILRVRSTEPSRDGSGAARVCHLVDCCDLAFVSMLGLLAARRLVACSHASV